MERINTKENLLKTNTILDDYLKFYKSQIYLFFGKTGIGKSSLLIDLGDGLTNFYSDKNFENDKEHYKILINLLEEIAYKYNILVLTTSYYNERLNYKINYLIENNINPENLRMSTKDLKNFEILEPILSGIIGMTDIGFCDKTKFINLQILKQRFGLINSNININFKPENQYFEYFLR